MREETLASSMVKAKKYIGYAVVSITLVVFYWYITTHPDVLTPLKQVPVLIVPLLLLLYMVFLLSNLLITASTIRLCRKTYSFIPSLQLTIYSTLINFFGPLQSGPGFRALYLKHKLGIKVKDYTAATLLYYLSFALISLGMMFGPILPLATFCVVILLGGLGYYIIRPKGASGNVSDVVAVVSATLLQLSLVAVIYFIELWVTGTRPSIASALTYTGAANFALFVSVTPGAIGVRESFIVFSQSLHGIPTERILAASLLDRAMYLLFLLVLFLISTGLHLNTKLRLRSTA